MSCTLSYINSFTNFTEKCIFISENCASEYINFYHLHYCTFHSIPFLTIPIFLIILFLLFYLLSNTSDSFLSEAVTNIVDTFQINQNVAAVTLLAFGNGAPDVISSLVASAEIEGVSLSIGNLLGTGLFVTSFVLGLVVYTGKEVKVDQRMFYRDLLLYLISLVFLLIVCLVGKVNLIESCGFILIYFINIAYAIYQDRNNNEEVEHDIYNIGEIKGMYVEEEKRRMNNIENKIKEEEEKIKYNREIELANISNSIFDRSSKKLGEQIIEELKEDIEIEKAKYIAPKRSCGNRLDESVQLFRLNMKKKYFTYKEEDWNDVNTFWRYFYIVVEIPLTFIREITIPFCNEKRWHKTRFCLTPIFGYLFILYATGLYSYFFSHLLMFFVILFSTIKLSGLLYIFTKNSSPPRCHTVISVFTFAMSLIWIYFTANNLISLLQTIAFLLNVPDAFLGMTVLTYGNSISDLMLNLKLVKTGYGEMALTGSIAGPLFNLLIGLGISLVKLNIKNGTIDLNVINRENLVSIVSYFVLVCNLVCLGVLARVYEYYLNRRVSLVGFTLYGIFFVTVCLLTFA